MTTLWSNYKTVSNETIKSLQPFFKDSTDEEIKEITGETSVPSAS